MDITRAFPSKYLKAEDIGESTSFLVSHVSLEDIDGEELPVLHFQGEGKGIVLNRTNAKSIAALHGAETDHWTGKGITLYASETDYQGRRVPCIRVREAGTMPPPSNEASAPSAAAPAYPSPGTSILCQECYEQVPAVTQAGLCIDCAKALRSA